MTKKHILSYSLLVCFQCIHWFLVVLDFKVSTGCDNGNHFSASWAFWKPGRLTYWDVWWQMMNHVKKNACATKPDPEETLRSMWVRCPPRRTLSTKTLSPRSLYWVLLCYCVIYIEVPTEFTVYILLVKLRPKGLNSRRVYPSES